jgi:hypothetical protein
MRGRVFVAALLGLILVLPAAQSRPGKGKPPKGETTSVIVVFRDALGLEEDGQDRDLFRSKGGAYVDGEPGIKESILMENGNFRLVFPSVRDRDETTRQVRLEFPPGSNDSYGCEPDEDPNYFLEMGELDITPNHLFVGTDDGYGANIEDGFRAVKPKDAWAWARIPLFFYDPNITRVQWKLSYSDSRLWVPPDVEGAGLGRVTCKWTEAGECVAWRVDKETGKTEYERNRAVLLSGKEKTIPSAGEWILPFAIGVCDKGFFETNYPDDPANACRLAVGFPSP